MRIHIWVRTLFQSLYRCSSLTILPFNINKINTKPEYFRLTTGSRNQKGITSNGQNRRILAFLGLCKHANVSNFHQNKQAHLTYNSAPLKLRPIINSDHSCKQCSHHCEYLGPKHSTSICTNCLVQILVSV